jgi:hypothetical protein
MDGMAAYLGVFIAELATKNLSPSDCNRFLLKC